MKNLDRLTLKDLIALPAIEVVLFQTGYKRLNTKTFIREDGSTHTHFLVYDKDDKVLISTSKPQNAIIRYNAIPKPTEEKVPAVVTEGQVTTEWQLT